MGDVVAAVGGGAFQRVGHKAVSAGKISRKDLGFRQPRRFNAGAGRVRHQTQRFGGVTLAAHNDVVFGKLCLHRVCEFIPSAENAAAEEHGGV